MRKRGTRRRTRWRDRIRVRLFRAARDSSSRGRDWSGTDLRFSGVHHGRRPRTSKTSAAAAA